MQQNTFNWEAALWRWARGFIGALIALIIAAGVSAFLGLQAVPINFSQPSQTAHALLIAFVLGFLSALFKLVRDRYGNPDGSGVINKIPV